jgi:hypothetical protein
MMNPESYFKAFGEERCSAATALPTNLRAKPLVAYSRQRLRSGCVLYELSSLSGNAGSRRASHSAKPTGSRVVQSL